MPVSANNLLFNNNLTICLRPAWLCTHMRTRNWDFSNLKKKSRAKKSDNKVKQFWFLNKSANKKFKDRKVFSILINDLYSLTVFVKRTKKMMKMAFLSCISWNSDDDDFWCSDLVLNNYIEGLLLLNCTVCSFSVKFCAWWILCNWQWTKKLQLLWIGK